MVLQVVKASGGYQIFCVIYVSSRFTVQIYAVRSLPSVLSQTPKALPNIATSSSVVLDVTSRGKQPFIQLSPFYPHGGITYKDVTSCSVEGLWQGLKVFTKSGIDRSVSVAFSWAFF